MYLRFLVGAALVALGAGSAAEAATINCGRLSSQAGVQICRSSDLRSLLDQENALYLRVRASRPDSAFATPQAEAAFANLVRSCGYDSGCIQDRIEDRITALSADDPPGEDDGQSSYAPSSSENGQQQPGPIVPAPAVSDGPTDNPAGGAAEPTNQPLPAAASVAAATLPAPATSSGSVSPLTWIVVLTLIVGIPVLIMWRNAGRRRRAQQAFWRIVAQHKDALAKRSLQLIRRNAYGVPDETAWSKEQEEFYRTIMRPDLRAAGVAPELVERTIAEQRHSLSPFVQLYASKLTAGLEFDPKMSPRDFEQFCAGMLNRLGWATDLTSVTGDQGVDIYATRDGTSLVVQCKLYATPVGNKAVQEAHTAKVHMGADIAAVVSNASYTPLAQQLARTTATRLLHYTELDQL